MMTKNLSYSPIKWYFPAHSEEIRKIEYRNKVLENGRKVQWALNFYKNQRLQNFSHKKAQMIIFEKMGSIEDGHLELGSLEDKQTKLNSSWLPISSKIKIISSPFAYQCCVHAPGFGGAEQSKAKRSALALAHAQAHSFAFFEK